MKKLSALIISVLLIFSVGAFTGAAASTTRPAKVSKVTTTVTSNTATVKWNAVSGASGYRFYDWDFSQKKWVVAVSATSKTGMEISGLEPGKKYYFAVKPYKKVSGKTVWAESYTKITVVTRPDVVTQVNGSCYANSISLSWSKATGATGYRVYQYMPSSKSWKALKTTTSRSYKVTGLSGSTKYIFAVKPYTKKSGITSWASSYTKVNAATQPPAPATMKYTSTSSSVTLTWSKVSGATGYVVYKYNSSSGSWSTYKDTTSTSVTISSLSSNTSYTFAVGAYIKSGDNKIHSASQVSITAKTTGSSSSGSTTGTQKPENIHTYGTYIVKNTPGKAGLVVRKYSSSSSTKLCTIPEGAEVIAMAEYSSLDNGYTYVYVPDYGVDGWVMATYLAPAASVNPSFSYTNFTIGMLGRVKFSTPNHSGINMRSSANSSSSLLCTLPEGAIVEIASSYSSYNNGYIKVTYDHPHAGYVMTGWVLASYLEYYDFSY